MVAATARRGGVVVLNADRRRLVLAAGASALARPALARDPAVLEAVYPRMPERPTDAYGYRLLKLALEASGRPFRLSLTAEDLPSVRAFKSLEAGEFNVMDAGSGRRLDTEARILPFPLDLGLSGYRLMLVRRDRVPALREVRSLDDLKRLRFGQGPDWSDTRILRHAGLLVQEAQFLNLFRMLEVGRFDAFPLGADEAENLLDRYRHLAPSAVVLDAWGLRYPFARVLVVNREAGALYDALYDGLTRLFHDGRARAALAQDPQIGPLLTGKRRLPPHMLMLPNPEWTGEYLRIPQSLFFNPE